MVGRDTETTEGTANSYRSLKARSIAEKDSEERKTLRSRRLSRLGRKPSLQLRLLTERNKLHTTKKAGQRAARVVREGHGWHPRSHGQEPHPIGQTDYSSRRPPTKEAQEVIQFEQVDFEQVAEKRQACDVAKNDTNLAMQSGVSKNTQHNVK